MPSLSQFAWPFIHALGHRLKVKMIIFEGVLVIIHCHFRAVRGRSRTVAVVFVDFHWW